MEPKECHDQELPVDPQFHPRLLQRKEPGRVGNSVVLPTKLPKIASTRTVNYAALRWQPVIGGVRPLNACGFRCADTIARYLIEIRNTYFLGGASL